MEDIDFIENQAGKPGDSRIRQQCCRYAWFVFIIFVIALHTPLVHAEYDYITITDPFIKKIPVAVPDFKPLSSAPGIKEHARNAAVILKKCLEFTGYFKIMDPGAFLENPAEKGIDEKSINFKNWVDIGAEMLITGGVDQSDGVLQLELRLFDPFRGELLLGKRYTGKVEDTRRMILRFANEIIRKLTGRDGVFLSRIVYIDSNGEGKKVCICEFDGSNRVCPVDAGEIALSPVWSPEGTTIAYTSYKSGTPAIYLYDIFSGKETKIAFEGINLSPAWFPDGKKIAATLSFDGDEEIYLLTTKGGIVKRLTMNWGIDVSPVFSPDGKKMAFVSKRSGSPQIYIKDLETGRDKRLTFEGRYNTEPDWSPDGRHIVFTGMHGGATDIYVIETNGENLKRLTHDSGHNEHPRWSPDGSMIVFSSNRTGHYRIFVMTASGTDQRMLFSAPGDQKMPDWSPAVFH